MARVPAGVSALLQEVTQGLPAILGTNLAGIYLYGSLTQGAFNPKRSDVDCIVVTEREVGYLRDEIIMKPDSEWRDVPSYRAYAVLTLCRILYTFKKGAVVSKPRAARWAVKNLPDEFGAIILQALAAADSPADIPLSQIERFVDFADTQLHT